MKLSQVIDELVEERGLDRAVLGSIICEGMLAAYQKRYPLLDLKADYDQSSDELVVLVEKEVVSNVEDGDAQISLKKGRFIDNALELGDMLWVPFDGRIGRIEILRAKQVIAQKIRNIEAQVVYDEFKPQENSIVHGTIHKCERAGISVKVQDNLAFLPKSLSIPTDKCIVGYTIRALLKEVLPEPRNENQLILDRSSDLFLQKLFELEIPEVFEKLVEVKKIVRIPGYKAKIAVSSNDQNIDPVGTCVGVGGSRIKPILKELGTEKIDIIQWTEAKEVLIKNSLKPAEINRVELVDDENAKVWLDDDQRSLAIGRMGQNISLASGLTGYKLHLVDNIKKEERELGDIAVDIEQSEEQ